MTPARSLSTAPTITATRNTAERMRTGRSRPRASAGRRARTNMPIATGTSTTTKTCATLPGCMETARSPVMKCASEELTISGSVRSESTALTAVRVMLSATSPLARWLKRLAEGPPGDAARSIKPTASSGERWNPRAMKKPTAGRRRVWQTIPITTARG